MKKTVVKLLPILLTLILLAASAAMTVYAVDWDGTASGSGGASGVPANGGFSVNGNMDLKYMLVGYRFSYAKYNGSSWQVQGGTGMDGERCIEVWLTSSQTYLGTSTLNTYYSSASVYNMYPLTTKIEYVNAWRGLSETQYPTLTPIGTRARNLVRLGMAQEAYLTTPQTINGHSAPAARALPVDVSRIGDWCRENDNLKLTPRGNILPIHLPFDNTPLLVPQIAYPQLFEFWDIISYLRCGC